MKKIFCVVLCIAVFLLIFPVNAEAVSAKSAVVICGDTGEILYSKNCDTRMPMASTTKIMTALLLCENGDLEREITVTKEMVAVEGSSMGLLAGDKVTLYGLLYGMMLASGNDAANVTAYTLGGSVDGFAAQMNRKAKEIGMQNTHFETPSGLDSKEHYSTAYDMALLARCALLNEDFAKAVSSKSATLEYGNPPYKRTLTNHNKLLKFFDGAIGVKTGFTKKSGRCLVSAAERDGKKVLAVTLNDPDDWQDHKSMLEYGLSKIQKTQISPPKTDYKISVIGGVSDEINVKIEPYVVTSLDSKNFSCEVRLPQFVYAPVKKGETLGNAVYKNGETVIKTIPIYANYGIEQTNLKKSFFEELKENMKCIFNKIWEK